MISKELLSVVLGYEIIDISAVDIDNDVPFMHKDYTTAYINIYELAHKCKEWAFNQGYKLASYKHNQQYNFLCVDMCSLSFQFSGDTEPEAIFKACQWILDNEVSK